MKLCDLAAMNELLASEEKKLGFNSGFKLLYCPVDTISKAKIAFISLNPGADSDVRNIRTFSDEEGNSYEIEKSYTKSPLTKQFLLMCEYLNVKPHEILTGAAVPFRSNNWKELSFEQKKYSLLFGQNIWAEILSHSSVKTIIVCSREPIIMLDNIMKLKINLEISANWGDAKLRRYISENNTTVIQLPHLSRFKIFGRQLSQHSIDAIFSRSAGAYSN